MKYDNRNLMQRIYLSVDGQLSPDQEATLTRQRQEDPTIEDLYQQELKLKQAIKTYYKGSTLSETQKSAFWQRFYASIDE